MNPINNLKITKFVVGYIETNMYLITSNNKGVIIDPGFIPQEADTIVSTIKKNCDEIPAVFLTHTHYDHISGLKIIKERFNSTIYCHSLDRDKIQDNKKNGALFFEADTSTTPCTDEYVTDDQKLKLLGLEFKIIHTPGHSSGSISILLLEKYIFSGDTIFKGSIGRTDLFDGSYQDEIISIKKKILTLSPETRVYPGHGPETTVADEKPYFQ